MDLEPANKQLTFAQNCIDRMKIATNFDDYDEAWTDYLSRIENIFNRIWAASSPVREKFVGFSSKVNHLRKTDELLIYLKQARNTVHHGIADTSKSIPAAFNITAKDVPVHIKDFGYDSQGNLILVSTGPLNVKFQPERVELIPCTNRGETYYPPRHHKGLPITGKDPLQIAILGLRFYSDFYNETLNKFCK